MLEIKEAVRWAPFFASKIAPKASFEAMRPSPIYYMANSAVIARLPLMTLLRRVFMVDSLTLFLVALASRVANSACVYPFSSR